MRQKVEFVFGSRNCYAAGGPARKADFFACFLAVAKKNRDPAKSCTDLKSVMKPFKRSEIDRGGKRVVCTLT